MFDSAETLQQGLGMWTRKYVTFHLRDARRCKAAARSARQLRGRGTSGFAKLQTSRFEEVEILSFSLGGWRDLEPQDEC